MRSFCVVPAKANEKNRVAPERFFRSILDRLAFLSHYVSMNYAISCGGLAGLETRVSGQVQPGWIRKEGADVPSFARFADTKVQPCLRVVTLLSASCDKNYGPDLGVFAALVARTAS